MNHNHVALLILLILIFIKCDNDDSIKILIYNLQLTKPNSKDDIVTYNTILNQLDLKIPTITLCLGTPPQCFLFSLSFTPFIYVFGYNYNSRLLKYYDKSYSVSYMGTSIRRQFLYQSVSITSQLVYDYISDSEENGIQSNVSERCPFYVITEEKEVIIPGEIAGGLGLMTNKNENSSSNKGKEILISYVKHLYLHHYINHNSFTIYYNDINGGTIDFGQKPNADKDIQYCNSRNGVNYEWFCPFHKIQIGYTLLNTDLRFLFDPSFPLIAGPSVTVIHYFEALLSASKNKCAITKENAIDVFICPFEVNLKKLPDLSFIYAYSYFRLRVKDMFVLQEIKGEMKNVCLIVGHTIVDWRLGLPAFKNKVLIFDQEDEKIGFYSEEKPDNDIDEENTENQKCNKDNSHEIIINKKDNYISIMMMNSMTFIGGIGVIIALWSKHFLKE